MTIGHFQSSMAAANPNEALDLVAGVNAGVTVTGFLTGVYGSLTPDTFGSVPRTVNSIQTNLTNDALSLALIGEGIPQDDFRSLQIDGGALDGTLVFTADATYNGAAGGFSIWTWTGLGDFVNGSSQVVLIGGAK